MFQVDFDKTYHLVTLSLKKMGFGVGGGITKECMSIIKV